jgi:hypothetical protein
VCVTINENCSTTSKVSKGYIFSCVTIILMMVVLKCLMHTGIVYVGEAKKGSAKTANPYERKCVAKQS